MARKKKIVKKIMNENKISNKPVYKFLGFILFLVLLFFVSSYLIKMTYNFDYQELSFTKEKFGDLKVYHHYYYFKDGYGELFQYNLYLRNDPRENNVSVDGKIVYPSQKDFIYITRKKNSMSGNNYHTGKNLATNPKIFILLSGEIDFSYRPVATNHKHTITISALALIEIKPNTIHAVKALTDIIIIECNSIADIEQDNFKEAV